jgi:serine protease DegQ
MRRPAFYSRSPRTPSPAAEQAAYEADAAASPDTAGAGGAVQPPRARAGWQPGRKSFALLLVLCAALVTGGTVWWPRQGKAITQKDIDAAVLRTMQTATLPSPAARAADIIRPSVVRVVSYGPEKATPEAKTQKRGRNMAKGKPPEAPARRRGARRGRARRGHRRGDRRQGRDPHQPARGGRAPRRSRSPSPTGWRRRPSSPASSPRTTSPCCRRRRFPTT